MEGRDKNMNSTGKALLKGGIAVAGFIASMLLGKVEQKASEAVDNQPESKKQSVSKKKNR